MENLLREHVWWAVYVAFNLLVVFYDLRVRRVPNRLLIAAALAQCAWLAWHAWGVQATPAAGARGWSDAGLGFVLGMAFVLVWRMRLMGAGDVKYLAVLGLAIGAWPWLLVLVLAGLPSLAHALAQGFQVVRDPRKPRRGIPYAAYLALAAISLGLMPSSSPWCSWCSSWFFTAV
ncbi:prepilin peptidase [Bordetella parapertussis]|uniref:Membrane protein n=1 Tax=Bordetella parapertussis (strain Bpp5) TaxID=1208660 RepID=K0MC37_BORPB|nr:A24 family peptidase [Bordetella parapertussis]CCJ48858.1 putative membrane protein [Bordetella parapertussis Bpp5]